MVYDERVRRRVPTGGLVCPPPARSIYYANHFATAPPPSGRTWCCARGPRRRPVYGSARTPRPDAHAPPRRRSLGVFRFRTPLISQINHLRWWWGWYSDGGSSSSKRAPPPVRPQTAVLFCTVAADPVRARARGTNIRRETSLINRACVSARGDLPCAAGDG